MPTLSQIRRAFEADNAPLFIKARGFEQRLTEALSADIGRMRANRLRKLRSYVRHAMREFNKRELTHFLALYEPTIDSECRFAEPEAVAMVQSVVGLAA